MTQMLEGREASTTKFKLVFTTTMLTGWNIIVDDGDDLKPSGLKNRMKKALWNN